MRQKRVLLYITYIMILSSVARGIPILNWIPLSVSKFYLILLSIGCIAANSEIVRNKFIVYYFVFIIYMSFTFLITNNSNVTYYSNSLAALLIVAPFYYFSKFGVITQKNYSFFLIALLIVIIYSFQYTRSQIIFDRGSENITTNYGYFFVTMLPFVFILKRKWLKYTIIIVSLIASVIAAKRGAIIITFFVALYFFFMNMHNNEQKFKFSNVLITLVILAITVYYVYVTMLSSNQFLNRLDMTMEGYSSGRDDIYRLCMNFLFTENIFNLFFGNGYFSTISIIGIEAHNDWLQSLMDYGLIGTFFYFLFIVSLFIKTKTTISKKHQIVYAVILFIWVMKSLFSMQYCNFNTIFVMMALGIVIGDQNRKHEDSLLD